VNIYQRERKRENYEDEESEEEGELKKETQRERERERGVDSEMGLYFVTFVFCCTIFEIVYCFLLF
jgi:hypothetical protein